MLSQLQRLSVEAEGRYASDTELKFLSDYLPTFNLRLQTYAKLRSVEGTIVEQVQTKMKSLDASLLRNGNEDVSNKWKQDTFRVLRHSAIAVLTDDTNRFKDQFLYWFQTIMQAFGTEQSCNVTYTVMQDVVKKVLTPAEAELVCPVLELTRTLLGKNKDEVQK